MVSTTALPERRKREPVKINKQIRGDEKLNIPFNIFRKPGITGVKCLRELEIANSTELNSCHYSTVIQIFDFSEMYSFGKRNLACIKHFEPFSCLFWSFRNTWLLVCFRESSRVFLCELDAQIE